MRARLDAALRISIACCGAVGLVAVFASSRAVGKRAPALFSLESHVLPVALASCLAVWLLLRAREPARAACDRILDGRLESRDRRAITAFLILITAVGFALRIAHTHALVFNGDESQLLWVASARDPGEIWHLITTLSPHPPGYFALLHVLAAVSWDPLWIRLPSVVAGTVTIWLGYLLGRELFGRSAGMALALLVCLAPPFIELSRIARNYSIPLALLVAATFLLARGLRTKSPRDLAAASLLGPFIVVFHYVFIVAYVGMGLATAGVLLLQRAAARDWVRILLLQLPFVGLAGFLYWRHISVLPESMGDAHRMVYDGLLALEPSRAYEPFLRIWLDLAPTPLAPLLAVLSLLGVLLLVLRRDYRGLLLCVGPLVAGYGVLWAGLLPFGGTRHSAYTFPFLLALVAANVPEALRGYPTLRAHMPRFGRPERVPPDGDRGKCSARGLAWTALVTLLVANAALFEYERYHFAARLIGGRPKQLPIGYLVEDLAASFEVLEKRVGPSDVVLLTNAGRFQFITFQEIPPLVGASEDQRRDLRYYSRDTAPATSYEHRGVPYYTSRMGLSPTGWVLSAAVRRIRSDFDLGPTDRVWILRGAREIDIERVLARDCASPETDPSVHAATGGVLVAVDAKSLSTCRRPRRPLEAR